jgi:hypothetical protein
VEVEQEIRLSGIEAIATIGQNCQIIAGIDCPQAKPAWTNSRQSSIFGNPGIMAIALMTH